jgi:hypothetical protein
LEREKSLFDRESGGLILEREKFMTVAIFGKEKELWKVADFGERGRVYGRRLNSVSAVENNKKWF